MNSEKENSAADQKPVAPKGSSSGIGTGASIGIGVGIGVTIGILLATGKITSQEFETIKRGLENS